MSRYCSHCGAEYFVDPVVVDHLIAGRTEYLAEIPRGGKSVYVAEMLRRGLMPLRVAQILKASNAIMKEGKEMLVHADED